MEDKFTKLNLNGVEKYVSAIYDGSGNDITATYETKTDATSKETALSGRITTVSEALEALTGRVTDTEGFATEIESNKTNIQANLESINALKEVDETFQESLDYQSPSSYIIAEQTASGAVSVRRIRGPSVTVAIPAARAFSTSLSSNPPSGPMKTFIFFLSHARRSSANEPSFSHSYGIRLR